MSRQLLSAALAVPLLAGCIPIPYKGSEWIDAPLAQAPLPTGEAAIKAGDSVRFRYRKSGRVDEFEVVELKDGGFIGVAWDRKRYRLNYAEASEMWVERSRWRVLLLRP